MIKNYIRNGLLILGAIAIFAYLSIQAQAIDPRQHSNYIGNIRQLEAIDARLHEDILELRLGQLSSYEPVMDDLDELERLQNSLRETPSFIDPPGQMTIQNIIGDCSLALYDKKTLIEDFKLQNEILTESLAFFPVAVTDLIDEISDNQADAELGADLKNLLENVLIYNLSNSEALATTIRTQIDALNRNRPSNDALINQSDTNLEMVLNHAEIIVEGRPKVDRFIEDILSMSVNQHSEQIFQAYNRYYEQAVQRSNFYRLLLFGFSFIVMGFVSTSIIMTMRRSAMALNEAKEKYLSIFQNASEGIFQTLPEGGGHYLSVNPAMARIYGYDSPQDLINNVTNVEQQIYVDPKRRLEFIQAMNTHGAVSNFETQIYQTDGQIIWISENARTVRDEAGNMLYYEGFIQDITERKMAQQALQKAYAELEQKVKERTSDLSQANKHLQQQITERKQTEEKLARRNLVVETLNELSHTSISSLEMGLVLNNVARVINESVDATSTYIARWDASQGLATVIAEYISPNANDKEQISDLGYAYERQLYDNLYEWDNNPQDYRITRSDDPNLSYEIRSHMEQYGGKVTVEIPIYVVDECIGSIEVWESRFLRTFNKGELDLIQTIANQLGSIIDRARLFEAQKKQRQIAESLRQVALALNTSLDHESVLNKIIEQLGYVIQYDMASVLLQIGDDLVLSSSSKMAQPYLGYRIQISSNEFAARVFKQNQLVIIPDIQADPQQALWLVDESLRSWMGAPLLIDEQAIGVLTTTSFEIDAYDEYEGQLLQSFANQAAIAIKNARMFEDTQKALQRTERLYSASLALGLSLDLQQVLSHILDELQQIVPYDSASVQELKQDYLEIIGGNGFVNHQEIIGLQFYLEDDNPNTDVIKQRQAVIIDDVRQEYSKFETEPHNIINIRSWLGIPLLFGDQLLGMMAIDKQIPGYYTPDHARLATAFAAQAAIAIKNAQLYTNTQDALIAARTANKAKSRFLANMSHELRTPLNAILGFAQVMRQEAGVSAEQKENLEVISSSGEHLLTLINDILEMSKIEAGRATFNRENFNLHQLLGNLENMFSRRAKEKGIELSVVCHPNVPNNIATDEGKLRQVLINLLSNAIKFTDEGSISVRASVKENLRAESTVPNTDDGSDRVQIKFEVEDSGCGIASEELLNLFDPFTQTQSGQQLQQGTGLGLAISRQFIQLMGGEIRVTSELGQGSNFEFDITAQLCTPIDFTTPKPARQVIGLAADQSTFRILIVEDNRANRMLLVKLLQPLGFEIREAKNGLEAIEIWQAWQPHLIWMDIRMPIMDGYEATHKIKATPQGQETIIIALTANAFEEDRVNIISKGFDDFVRKPVQTNVIYEMMANHLGVKFIYNENEQQQNIESKLTTDPQRLTPDTLAVLSPNLIAALHEATVMCDLKLIHIAIDYIQEQDGTIANSLTKLADNFAFDEILALIERKS